MSDLKQYIDRRKKKDKKFAEGYEEGYEQLKIGVMFRQARESAGITQEELAHRLKTQKTAISRIENHAEDIKLSTRGCPANLLLRHNSGPRSARPTSASYLHLSTSSRRPVTAFCSAILLSKMGCCGVIHWLALS